MSTLFVFTSVSFADPNIASNSNSATCNDSTLETYSGTSNLSANWGANTINLHWYADENATTELTVPTTSQTCVYDSTLTPPPVANIPQKTGYTFVGWKVRGLPEGYTKLQYIESTGTQYIDTGYMPTIQLSSIEFKVNTASTNLSIFGVDNGSSRLQFYHYETGYKARIYTSGDKVTNVVGNINIDITGKIDTNNKTLTINGVTGNPLTATKQNYSRSIFLFAMNYNGSVSTISSSKIYWFKIYEGNTLVRNLIPAKNSSNVVGMYDLVTKTFFTNAGTGSFTAGPVAQ